MIFFFFLQPRPVSHLASFLVFWPAACYIKLVTLPLIPSPKPETISPAQNPAALGALPKVLSVLRDHYVYTSIVPTR